MSDLLNLEREYLSKKINYIAGMDEAGRGPLAGPVMIGCCIMDLSDIIPGVNDSKKLTAKEREYLYNLIKEKSICAQTVSIDHEEIDKINILNATKKGMHLALKAMFPIPEVLLVDAVKSDFEIPYQAVIGGDAISYSIAAASILAKVERDRLMVKYSEMYPEYGFERHKGYATKLHIEMLKKYGPCPIHRKTFLKNFFQIYKKWINTE
ncbi:MAG: ribonuclease HII [Clostridiales bacterium]|nr:ribonuclease HII [Clostridiales bacterium]